MRPANPTPEQIGYAMGIAMWNFPVSKLATRHDDALARADISQSDYLGELFLLCASAAVHAVRSAPLSLEVCEAVVRGLTSRLAESPEVPSLFALSHLESCVEYYAEAAAIDSSQPDVSRAELSEIEAAFAERLLCRGAENEGRGRACIELCIVLPKTLWKTYVEMAETVLVEDGLMASR